MDLAEAIVADVGTGKVIRPLRASPGASEKAPKLGSTGSKGRAFYSAPSESVSDAPLTGWSS